MTLWLNFSYNYSVNLLQILPLSKHRIQHLIPIEVKSSTNNEDTRPIADVSNQAVRPRRTAAVIGEISRRQMNIV